MRQYLDALKRVLDEGVDREGRNGKTRALFGMQVRYNMNDGFPAVTTKRLAFNAVKAELLWFLSGSSDNRELQEMGCHIWDANAEADYWKPKAAHEGDLGRIYGVQWRSFQSPGKKPVDQIARMIEGIRNDPYGRRHVVVAWNPGELEDMALPPCHMAFQFFVAENRLDLQLYQRSCDMFLGVPFNIASYSLLLHMVAQVTGLMPREFIHTLGDAHIYHDHLDQVRTQIQRKPLALSRLSLNPDVRSIDDFRMEDIELLNYRHHTDINAPMAV
jgi:thymidylate synthase